MKLNKNEGLKKSALKNDQAKIQKVSRHINNFIVYENSRTSIHLLHSQIVNPENHFIVHEEITRLVKRHILKHFQQKTTDRLKHLQPKIYHE